MTDPYIELFDTLSITECAYLPTISKDDQATQDVIQYIKGFFSESFYRSVLSTHLIKVVIEMWKIDGEKCTELYLSKFNSSKWKVLWTASLCTHLSLHSLPQVPVNSEPFILKDEGVPYQEEVIEYLKSKDWFSSEEDFTIFKNLLRSMKDSMFATYLKDISNSGESYRQNIQFKKQSIFEPNLICVLLLFIGKYCWNCSKFAVQITETMLNKKIDQLTIMDKLNLMNINQNYCVNLIKESIFMYSEFHRFDYEQSLYFYPILEDKEE